MTAEPICNWFLNVMENTLLHLKDYLHGDWGTSGLIHTSIQRVKTHLSFPFLVLATDTATTQTTAGFCFLEQVQGIVGDTCCLMTHVICLPSASCIYYASAAEWPGCLRAHQQFCWHEAGLMSVDTVDALWTVSSLLIENCYFMTHFLIILRS